MPPTTPPLLHSPEPELLQQTSSLPLIAGPDLLVIGTELTGMAAASMAVEKGWKVQVIAEPPLDFSPAAHGNGLIWPSSLAGIATDDQHEFAFYCRDLWSRLTVRPGMEFEWKVPGILAFDDAPLAQYWLENIARLQSEGWSIQSVDSVQIQSLLREWKQPATGGLFFPADGQINPSRTLLSFVRQILVRKSSIRTGIVVDKTNIASNGTIASVETPEGSITPRFLLLNDGSVPSDWLPEISLEAHVRTQHCLSGFIPLDTLPSNIPIVTQNTILIPRTGGSEIHVEVESMPHDPEKILQEAWAHLAGRWDNSSPSRVNCQNSVSRRTSSDHLPILETWPGFSNAWWSLSDARDPLHSAGLAQQLLEWMHTGSRPERLNTLDPAHRKRA